MSTLSELIEALEGEFDTMYRTFLSKVGVKAARALMADDAKLIGNQTAASLVKVQTDEAKAHIDRRDNPHGLTLAMFDAPSAEVVGAKTLGLIPDGVLPVSRFGNMTNGVIGSSASGTTITIPTQSVMVSGRAYQIASTTLALAVLFPAWQSKRFFIYLTGNGTTASYQVSLTELVETPSRMYIGYATTNTVSINALSLQVVTRIDNYRLSATPVGSAIPVSAGTPDAPATLPDAWLSAT